jgi:hypothetical protein
MSTFNPYAQAGWGSAGSASGHSIPSIQGALPGINFSGPSEPRWVSFRFASPTGGPTDVSNCAVVDPENRTRFTIRTAVQPAGRLTSIHDPNGGVVAKVEWQPQTVIELATPINNIPRQYSSQFLKRSTDGSSISMVLKGKVHTWTRSPQEGVIRWSNTSYSPAEQLGALFKVSASGIVCLSVAPSAISQGLLDVAVLITVLVSFGATVG